MLGIIPQKKKMAETIVSMGFGDGKGEVTKTESEPTDDSLAMKAIGEDIMKAIESKNPQKLAESIKTLLFIVEGEDLMADETEG